MQLFKVTLVPILQVLFDNNHDFIHAYGIIGTLPLGSNPRFRTIGKLFRYYW